MNDNELYCPGCENVVIPIMFDQYNPDECVFKCPLCGHIDDNMCWLTFSETKVFTKYE